MVDADEFNENIARWPSINYVRLFRDNFGFPSAYQKNNGFKSVPHEFYVTDRGN